MDEPQDNLTPDATANVSAESARLGVISSFAIGLVEIVSGQDLAWYAARQVVQKLGFADCVVYFLDSDENVLRQVAVVGAKNLEEENRITSKVIALGQTVAGTVAQSRAPILDNHLTKTAGSARAGDEAQSELCVPLVIGEKVFGVIDCNHPRADFFKPEHLELLATIAALTSARLQLIEQVDHLQLMQDLKFGEDRFHDFIDVASDWYWELDENLCYQFIFDKVEEDRAHTNAFFLGKRRSDVKPAVVDPEHWQSHLDDLEAHRPFRNLVQSRFTKEGRQIWQSVTGKPWFDAKGQFKGYRAAATDITDYHVAEENLRRIAEAANEAKSEFLASISHELRTPLTSSLGSLGLIKALSADDLSEQGHELLEIAMRNSQALLRLVNELLDYEKFQAGHHEIANGRFDLCKLTQNAVSDNQGFAQTNALQFVLNLAPGPLYAVLDQHRFEQIIANLLSNAAKFSEPGKDVEVCVSGEKGQVLIRVKDQGIGIPKAFHAKLFEPFRQADGSATRKHGGTGLGLSISKALTEQMGGTLDFETETGSGSTFIVAFPGVE